MMRPPVRRGTRQGFTLLELMVVLVILGILAAVLLPRLTEAGDVARERLARSFLSQLDAVIAEYEDEFGDYPPSHFVEAWGTPPNALNLGAEALVLSLWSEKWGGAHIGPEKLVNLDGDAAKKPLARLPRPDLYEIADEWGNPIAYIHRRDYGKPFVYTLMDPDTGELRESTVQARKDPVTQTWWRAGGYQLISAGPDGEFDGAEDDDIGNWSERKD